MAIHLFWSLGAIQPADLANEMLTGMTLAELTMFLSVGYAEMEADR